MNKIVLSFLAITLCVSINAQSDLVITEIMYNPPESGIDSLEFIEIYNKGAVALNLNNYTCTGGNYTFPNTTLAPGGFYVIAINSVAFNNVYGIPADGQFSNGLSNGGESIVLKDDLGNIMDSVKYDDASPWPSGSTAGNPDGGGASIILCDETSDNNMGNNWLSSTNSVGATINGFPVLASPGVVNSCPSCTPTFGIDALTECDSVTWTNGITYYANNFTAKDTLVNAAGCDSIVTLDLAVNYSTSSTDVISACDSLTWVDGITYYANNNTATFTSTNSSGCNLYLTLDLTINTSPVVTITEPAGAMQSMNCSGAQFTLQGNGADSYVWDDLSTFDTLLYVADTASQLSTITVTGTDTITGCASVGVFNIQGVYDPIVTSQTLSICNEEIITVGSNTYSLSGIYTDTLTALNGCDSVNTLNLTVQPAINITLTNTSPTLTANQTGASYQWINCDSSNAIIPGETNQNFTATMNGNYAVEITVGNCADTSACVNISGVGINENSSSNGIIIYPNPTENLINISVEQTGVSVDITLISIEGKIIYKKQRVLDKKITLDISTNSKGIYFLKILRGKENYSYKIIKY